MTQDQKETQFTVEVGTLSEAQLSEDLKGAVDYSYANHVVVSVNKWEIRLTFADVKTSKVVKPLGGYVLTHGKAKKLLGVLADSIELLEKHLGEIEEPPDLPTPEKQQQAEKPESPLSPHA